jgi:hypothetical protein
LASTEPVHGRARRAVAAQPVSALQPRRARCVLAQGVGGGEAGRLPDGGVLVRLHGGEGRIVVFVVYTLFQSDFLLLVSLALQNA